MAICDSSFGLEFKTLIVFEIQGDNYHINIKKKEDMYSSKVILIEVCHVGDFWHYLLSI